MDGEDNPILHLRVGMSRKLQSKSIPSPLAMAIELRQAHDSNQANVNHFWDFFWNP